MSRPGRGGEGSALPGTPPARGRKASGHHPLGGWRERLRARFGAVGHSVPLPPIAQVSGSKGLSALGGGRSGGGRSPSPSCRAALAFALLLALAAPALAAVGRPEDRLADPAQESRAQEIGRELRCMVCQNQSIEDSDADLARDLRRIVRERVAAGDDSAAVMRFVHDRYGDFVLLRPPLNPVTALLWAMPVIALGGGLAVILTRRRRIATAGIEPAPLTEAERRRLDELERGTGA